MKIVKDLKELDTVISASNFIRLDCKGLVLGRLCSMVAKNLLKNEKLRVELVNISQILMTGSLKNHIERENRRLSIGHKHRGPFYSRHAAPLLRLKIRRMLPWSTYRGRHAFRRVFTEKCEGTPTHGITPVLSAHAFFYSHFITQLNGGRYV